MVTILLGNTIVLVPMVLNAHAGTKYGISFPVLCRASFGVRGANLPAMLRAIVACGWFGIQTWIGALALDALFQAAWPGWAAVPAGTAIAFAVFWLIQVAVILKGTEGIKVLESWSAPLLLARRRHPAPLGDPERRRARTSADRVASGCGTGARSFWALFPAALTASVGYWATLSLNIPDFTRYARSQRSQMLGQALGLPTTMTAFAFIGVAVTSATIVIFGEAIWDPVVLISQDRRHRRDHLRGAGGARRAAHDQHGGERRVAVERFLEPEPAADQLRDRRTHHRGDRHPDDAVEALLRRRGLHLHLAARLLEPDGRARRHSDRRLLGVRRQQLALDDLFREQGAYTYRNGVNWRAVAAFVIAILPVVPGFVRAVTTPGGAVADPELLRPAVLLRLVRDVCV